MPSAPFLRRGIQSAPTETCAASELVANSHSVGAAETDSLSFGALSQPPVLYLSGRAYSGGALSAMERYASGPSATSASSNATNESLPARSALKCQPG